MLIAALAAMEALTDEDQQTDADAAVRVDAWRWAADSMVVANGGRVQLQTMAGEPGQTCLLLTDAQHTAAAALAPNVPMARYCPP